MSSSSARFSRFSIGYSRARVPLPNIAYSLLFLGVVLPSGAVNGQSAPPVANAARADLTESRELVKNGKYPEAEAALAQLQTTFPDDPALLLLRGELLNTLGRPADAVGVLRHAAATAPAKKRVQFQLGTALSSTGDTAGALEAFAKEIELNPDPGIVSKARLNRKVLFEKDRKFAEAAAEMELFLQVDPDAKDGYADLAELYLDAARLDDAARTIERAEAAGVQSSRVHFRLGVAYFNQKAYDKAVASFSRAVEIQPDLAQAELALAKSLDRQNREEEAVPHYRRYLELHPKAPDAAEIAKRLQPAAKSKGSKAK